MAGPTTSDVAGEGRKAGTGNTGGAQDAPRRRPRLTAAIARRRRLLAVLVPLTVLVGGGTWAVYGTSLLEVRDVAVSGTRVLDPAEVRGAAAVPLGGPLADVDTSAVERRLRERLPRIESVEADRSWPHTLRLVVTERRPVAVVRHGSGYSEVDRTGVRFAHVSRAPKGAPLVELKLDEPGSPPSPSLRHFGTQRLLRAAVVVASAMPEAVRGQATSLEVRSYDDIRLTLTGERTVVWGSAELGSEKGKVLTSLLKAVPGARHYDVSAPSAPAAGN
ncbi:cell division protein FtsQ/DivIB [Wenjunlia tyrosinilytica]|uniref:Cell division protein FtsQ n=1 Tax=Wenjunlia tyrosinilytica TaxID=1544741 RepID=A0A917ZFA8_9ACTN|nr:FtsQ-type POTRA domain-containing protein [Wenjunlia tyrosinilytica]GGO81781.1 cell division protein FtsQ [Wenjunlia tyrosinilytica]